MNNELHLKKRHARHEQKLNDLQEHHAYLEHLMLLSKWLTFLLYLAFAIGLYIGDFMNLKTFLDTATGSIIGFLFYLTVCLLLAYVLSGIKHAAYSHMAMFQRAFTVIALVIFMGLTAEIFQAGGQQDAKARIIAESSSEHKALINQATAPTLPPDAGLTLMIAKAEQKLARCEHNVSIGRESHCNGDRAKVTALKNQVQANHQNQLAITTAQTEARAKRLDEIEKKSHNPTVRAIADFFQWDDIAKGIVMIMFVVAACFELSHYYLSEIKRSTLQAIDGLLGALDRLEVDFNEQVGHNIAEDKEATEQPRQAENRPIGFNQPVTAKKPLFKYQEKQPPQNRFIGFQDTNGKKPVRSNLTKRSAAKPEVPRPTSTPKIESRLLDPTKKNVLGSHEHQLDIKAFVDALPDEPEPKYDRYLDKVLQTGKANTEGEVKRFLADVGKPEKTSSKPLANRQEQPVQQTVSKPLANGLKSGLYGEWIKAVIAGDCKPSVKPTWTWIQKRVSPKETGKQSIHRTQISQLQKLFFSRALNDGYMQLNPKYKNGGKKYL